MGCKKSANSLLKKSTTIIKYEEVVTNPKSIISSLNKKLRTNVNLKNTNEIWKRSNYIHNESKRFGFFSKHFGMPITSKTIGSYKNVLNSDEINHSILNIVFWSAIISTQIAYFGRGPSYCLTND